MRITSHHLRIFATKIRVWHLVSRLLSIEAFPIISKVSVSASKESLSLGLKNFGLEKKYQSRSQNCWCHRIVSISVSKVLVSKKSHSHNFWSQKILAYIMLLRPGIILDSSNECCITPYNQNLLHSETRCPCLAGILTKTQDSLPCTPEHFAWLVLAWLDLWKQGYVSIFTLISTHHQTLCTTSSCLFGFVATRILFDSLSAVEHIVFWNIGVFFMFHNIYMKNELSQERHLCQLMFATLAMSEWTSCSKEADALISWQLSLEINKFDIRN